MKRIISLVLILSMVLTFSACNKTVEEDPITIYVGLGNTQNNGQYYRDLEKIIEEELGYDVELVFNNTMDTSNAFVTMAENNDLPADIVATAARLDDSLQQSAFLNFASCSNLVDLFPKSQINQLAINGAVYQLPLASRLIGIEYNKTLLNEMGWTLPSNFNEMVALKEQVDSEGVKFAVSGGVASGHGFNYLFNLMGSQYLFGASGTEWLEGFLSGKEDVTDFKSASSYFEKFTEAGLFGSIHDTDWNANTEYKETRALFYMNTINDVYSYDGFQYDDDGKIVGATYEGDEVVAVEDDNGNAVLVDDKYVWYDEDNEDYKDLQRYTIEGAKVLHDEYGIMPWISESGTGNYTILNNMYLALNKNLANDKEKLNKCIDIIELMTQEEAVSLFLDSYSDGIVYLENSRIDETRLYYDYKELIERGFIQPWYYNDFDSSSIVNVGEIINSYISGKCRVNTEEVMTFDDIFTELTLRRDERIKNEVDYCATLIETLDIENVAKLECIANGLSTQAAIDESGKNINVTVSILPYTSSLANLSNEGAIPVVQMKMYKGKINSDTVSLYVQSLTNTPVVILMTGAEIEELQSAGYNSSDRIGVDETYPIKVVTKNNVDLISSQAYYVAIPMEILDDETYKKFDDLGLVVKSDDVEIKGNCVDGLNMFFKSNPKVSKDSLEWN